MESLASTTLYLAIAASAVATTAYWAHTLGLGLVVRRLATPIGEGPAVASIERSDAIGWAQVSGRFATLATWTALALLSVSLIARWQAVDHAPWSNMYEFTIAFATAILAFYAVFPLARDPLAYPEHQIDGLKPHRVMELLLAGHEDPDHWIEIPPDAFKRKINALKKHKSQLGQAPIREMRKRIKERMAEAAKDQDFELAESFRRMAWR